MSTALELLQVGVSLIMQFLMNTDRGSVVAINRQPFDIQEEMFLNRPRVALILTYRFEQ